MWQYKKHQIKYAKKYGKVLEKHKLLYIAWEERTGKTGCAIKIAEDNKRVIKILIITKKKALEGWKEHLNNLYFSKEYILINYESFHKLTEYELDDVNLVILDEAHNSISSYPKPSNVWKNLQPFLKGKRIIYLSATPYAENLGLIYHQLALSSYTPFKKYTNFYKWFKKFGIPKMIYTAYGQKEGYKLYKKPKILKKLKPILNFLTRDEVGINQKIEVKIVKIKQSPIAYQLVNQLLDTSIIQYQGMTIEADTDMKLKTLHYQLEGGTLKHGKDLLILDEQPKIDYIKQQLPKYKSIAIMAHHVGERVMLKDNFPNATILSADGDAEGVDLHTIEKLFIYSMSYRTSKYRQRLARQANDKRTMPIKVEILVSGKPFIGNTIVKTVANKEVNFSLISYKAYIKKYKKEVR